MKPTLIFVALIALLGLFAMSTANADTLDVLWTVSWGAAYSDCGYGVIRTSDGNFVMVGSWYTDAQAEDATIVSVRPNGDVENHNFVGGQGAEYAYSLIQSEDGCFVVAGTQYSDRYHCFAFKVDSNLDLLWSISPDIEGNCNWKDLVQMEDGRYLMVGNRNVNGNYRAGWDIVNDLGYWQDSFTTQGNHAQFYDAVTNTDDGGFIIVGSDNGMLHVERWDHNQGLVWWRTFAIEQPYPFQDIVPTSDGCYAVMATARTRNGSDFCLLKITSDGDSLWSRTYGGEDLDEGRSLVQTSDNGFALLGFTESFGAGEDDYWLVKTDENGDSLWSQTFGGEGYDEGNSLVEVPEGGFVMCGGYDFSADDISSQAYLLRVASGAHLQPDWRIDIDAAVGAYHDNATYLGGARGAHYGYDINWDFGEPPEPPHGFIMTFFPHYDWNVELYDWFNSDVIPLNGDLDTLRIFNFTVYSDQVSANATLTFTPDENVRDSTFLFLHDPDTDSLQNLRYQRTYRFETPALQYQTHDFELIVGTGNLNPAQAIDAGWYLISIPNRPWNSRNDAVFGDDIGGPFDLYSYDPAIGYFEPDTLCRVRGYWLGLHYAAVLDVEGRPSLNTCTKVLSQGWNLIGAPFHWPTSIEDASFRRNNGDWVSIDEATVNGWVTDYLFTWDSNNSRYESALTLQPWRGYWYAVLVSGVTMRINPKWPGDGDIWLQDEWQPTEQDWHLNIIASGAEGSDGLARLGVASDAGADFDLRYDYAIPPSPPCGCSVMSYFYHENWCPILSDKFVQDIRAPLRSGEANQWELTVAARDTGQITLTWPEIDQTAMPYNFILKDMILGTTISMREYDYYAYQSDGPRNFQISVEALSAPVDGESLPTEFAITSIHPNPFNARTTINYSLPARSPVTLATYDLSGREVASVEKSVLEAGWHKATWDAGNLPSGIYFARLTTPSAVKTAKMTLVR